MTETLPCAWCDTANAPATRCKDCGRPKCDLCARCEPCIDGPLAEQFTILAATWLAAGHACQLADRISDPIARGTYALAIDPLLALAQAAQPFTTLAAAGATLIHAATP